MIFLYEIQAEYDTIGTYKLSVRTNKLIRKWRFV